jgi:NADH-quinone oxidoreductase subunit M
VPSEYLPYLITAILAVPALGLAAITFMPERLSRSLAIMFSCFLVLLSGMAWTSFSPIHHPGERAYQFEVITKWITAPVPISYHVGVDGMSLALVVLTSFVTLMAVLASDTITSRPKLYYGFVMLLTLALLGVFVSLDLLQFFVFYELELVPMYFLIAIWGGPRRDYAAMKFLIYTFFGGVLMLASLLFVYFQLSADDPGTTFDMVTLAMRCPLMPKIIQVFGFLGFFLAFIIKLPSFPFHTWLPDAHVEAPTPISMILAGLLLKMGSYGLVRICASFFPNVVADYGPWIMLLGAFNIVWGAIACLVQKDMKRIIAYSSVSHMGFVLMGVGAATAAALSGAIFQMISHGVISAALFFLVGTVYERTHTRQIDEIGGGLAKQMPVLFYFWMFAILANMGLPGLSGFVAETAVYYGAYTSPFTIVAGQAALAKGAVLFATSGVLLTACYMLWLLKRLFFGEELAKWKGHLSDARPNERLVAWAMTIAIFALGVYPLLLTNQYDGVARAVSITLQSRISM